MKGSLYCLLWRKFLAGYPIMIHSLLQQNSIKYDRAGSLAFLPGVLVWLGCFYMTCAIKLPMVSSA